VTNVRGGNSRPSGGKIKEERKKEKQRSTLKGERIGSASRWKDALQWEIYFKIVARQCLVTYIGEDHIYTSDRKNGATREERPEREATHQRIRLFVLFS
jgi:hypothetical protein